MTCPWICLLRFAWRRASKPSYPCVARSSSTSTGQPRSESVCSAVHPWRKSPRMRRTPVWSPPSTWSEASARKPQGNPSRPPLPSRRSSVSAAHPPTCVNPALSPSSPSPFPPPGSPTPGSDVGPALANLFRDRSKRRKRVSEPSDAGRTRKWLSASTSSSNLDRPPIPAGSMSSLLPSRRSTLSAPRKQSEGGSAVRRLWAALSLCTRISAPRSAGSAASAFPPQSTTRTLAPSATTYLGGFGAARL
mmetsp:Transcript_27168/g.43513  ORF Transcript_27168/g.43513 Transcript_27168/m.43513 type:complete len:248 (-) Transcript_27168:452-1195(-)